MQTFKAVIYIACVVGIVSSLTGLAAPKNGSAKLLGAVMAAVMLLAVVSPFQEDGFVLDIPDKEKLLTEGAPASMTELSARFYLNSAEREVEAYLNNKLRQAGYEKVRAVITAGLDEYNYIVIEKVSLSAAENDQKSSLEALIREDIPDCGIYFENESSGAENDDP